jgi:hypothetical protein
MITYIVGVLIVGLAGVLWLRRKRKPIAMPPRKNPLQRTAIRKTRGESEWEAQYIYRRDMYDRVEAFAFKLFIHEGYNEQDARMRARCQAAAQLHKFDMNNGFYVPRIDMYCIRDQELKNQAHALNACFIKEYNQRREDPLAIPFVPLSAPIINGMKQSMLLQAPQPCGPVADQAPVPKVVTSTRTLAPAIEQCDDAGMSASELERRFRL